MILFHLNFSYMFRLLKYKFPLNGLSLFLSDHNDIVFCPARIWVLSRLSVAPLAEVVEDVDGSGVSFWFHGSSAAVLGTALYPQTECFGIWGDLQKDLSHLLLPFFRILFAVCTALSAAPLDCGYSGELVVCRNPHSRANSLNWCVLSSRFLVLAYWDPLSLTTC